MKKLLYPIYVFLFVVFISYYGCSKSDSGTEPTPINEAETLVNYLESSGDYIRMASSFVMDAATYKTKVTTTPGKIYTIDVRAASDYNTKRLRGAVNVTIPNLLTHIKGLNIDNYDNIVVVCYSGQSAAYAVSLVRAALPLAQANKVVSLKFGMASIDSMFALTTWLNPNNVNNAGAASVQTNDPPAKPTAGKLPTINTGKTTGKEILEARVNALLAAGYGGTSNTTISYANLSAALSNYFIVNFWPTNLYKDPGHIPGAYNYLPAGAAGADPKTFHSGHDLKTLPTDKPIVLYCYTGQTSSYWIGYLRLLGYDARSLLYGGNGFMYDLMKSKGVANTFNPATDIKGYKDLLEP